VRERGEVSIMATELNGRKIYFPEAKSFADIFSSAESRDVRLGAQYPDIGNVSFMDSKFPKRGNGPMRKVRTYYVISSYCSIHGLDGRYDSVSVDLQPVVREWIERNVLAVEYDRISFQVNIWDDGRALISAQHSKIIGSYYLAIVDATTVPVEVKEEKLA
jgi:hypothetical protein